MAEEIANNKRDELIPVSVSIETIRTKIYTIRGRQVMLDSDLAEIYGYETKNFNRQVTNNAVKFEGEDFMFKLTNDEWEDLRCKNFTSSWGGSRYVPRVFTEQGVYMLMTVLKGDLAVRQSRALVRAFKEMKDLIEDYPLLLEKDELLRLSMQVNDNSQAISRIEHTIANDMATKEDLYEVIRSFSTSEKAKEYLIYDGQTFEADVAYADIYGKAKKKVYIVDNYIGPKTLMMLKSIPAKVDVIIFSDNIRNMLRLSEYTSFHTEYPAINVSFHKTGGKFHDRYIILDYKCRTEKIYHCGASSKDAGNRITSISKADNNKLYYQMINDLLLQPTLTLK